MWHVGTKRRVRPAHFPLFVGVLFLALAFAIPFGNASAPPAQGAGTRPYVPAPLAGGVPTVGSKASCVAATTTCSTGTALTVTAGSAIYLFLAVARSAATVSSVTDTAANTYTLGGTFSFNFGTGTLGEQSIYIYKADNVGASSDTITATVSSTSNIVLSAVNVRNQNLSSTGTFFVGTSGTSTSAACSITTTKVNSLLLSQMTANTSTGTLTLSGPGLRENTLTAGAGGTATVEALFSQSTTAAGSYTQSATVGAALPWICYGVSVRATQPPYLPPTTLTVGTVTTTSIGLSWVQAAGNGLALVNNTVFYSTGITPCNTNAVSTAGAATSKTITGLLTGVQYCFEVAAWNSSGMSPVSTQVVQTTAQVPPAPTALTVTGQTTTSVSLSWTLPSGGPLVNTTIYYSTGTSPCNTNALSIGNGASTTGTVIGLTSGVQYCFEITAWNATGQSLPSNQVVKTTGQVPAAPTALTVGVVTTTSIALSWTNPTSSGLVNDTVFYSTGTSPCNTNAVSTAGVATSKTVTGLTTATQYCFEVVAWNSTGKSAASNVVVQTTGQLPHAPTSLAVTGTTSTTITLTWTNPSGGGLVNITLNEYLGLTCVGTVDQESAGVVSARTDTGLTPSTQYAYTVVAWNATGAGPASSCVTAATNASGGGGGGGIGLQGFPQSGAYFVGGVLIAALLIAIIATVTWRYHDR
jgi:fibronectin type 3 domain-containing protein